MCYFNNHYPDHNYPGYNKKQDNKEKTWEKVLAKIDPEDLRVFLNSKFQKLSKQSKKGR